jgi:3',5'-cyclic AMP phosphodiesterase CpdA
MKFLHISDLHYHRSQRDNKKANALLKTIGERYPQHTLLITGDITDDGHPKQYDNAYKALKHFMGRIYIAPGNHDFGAVGNFYSRERALRFDEQLTIPLDQGGTFSGDNTPVVNVIEEGGHHLMLIALDTNLETSHPFDFACGAVGEGQLSALDGILSNPTSAAWKKILFFHHHPFMHNNPFMEMKDAEALVQVIYGRIHIVLFGHRHVWEAWENRHKIEYYLASDNSPGKDWAREIHFKDGSLSVREVSIKTGAARKKRSQTK